MQVGFVTITTANWVSGMA